MSAAISIPESKLFTHAVPIPSHIDEKNVPSYVRSEAEKIIPLALEDMHASIEIIETNSGRHAFFSAARKSDIEPLVDGCRRAGITPTFICGELFSLMHALLPKQTSDGYVILDMGAHNTSIGIFDHERTELLSVSVPFAGMYFTETIARILRVSPKEAETMKRNYGLDPKYEETKVPGILRECIGEIVRALKDAQLYVEKNSGVRIRECILAGGASLTPHIEACLAEHTGLSVSLGDPMQHVKEHSFFGQEVPALLYANVIGLALMGETKSGTNLLGEKVKRFRKRKKFKSPKVEGIVHVFERVRDGVPQFSKWAGNLILSAVPQRPVRFNRPVVLAFFFSLSVLFLGWVIIVYN
jgi:type IV pilus assembly protein PilM